MRWSYSVHTIMRRCQRQVAFGSVVASGTANDPVRREAYILKQLQHLSAWQGSVVHSVLEIEFLEDLRAGRLYDAYGLTAAAQDLACRQFAFSAAGHYRRPKQTKRAAGREYCAHFEHERGLGVSDEQLATVHAAIARCFENLGTQGAFLAELAAGSTDTRQSAR